MKRLLFAFALAAACDGSGPRAIVVVTSDAVDLDRARWSPDVVTAARHAGARLELELRPGYRGSLRVEAPGGCAVDEAIEAPRTYTRAMAAKLAVPEWLTDVGYDTDVEIEAKEGCDDARAIAVKWSEGTPKATASASTRQRSPSSSPRTARRFRPRGSSRSRRARRAS